MDYKKKYKEAQKWIESIYPELSHEQQMEAEAFFPELQESEDEKIREMLIRIYKKADMGGEIFGEGITYKQVIAWLEKQGKNDILEDAVVDSNDDGLIADTLRNKKIEPKFKVGNWITNGDYTWKIIEVKPLDYILQSQDGSIVDDTISHVDEQFHSFTIKDAKDGDVLAAHECVVLFKEIDGLNIKCYCTYHYIGFNPSFYVDTLQNKTAFQPATKELRDLLFQKMKEAGYEWDTEKKELKKISQRMVSAEAKEALYDKPAWSEEDMKEALRMEYEKGMADVLRCIDPDEMVADFCSQPLSKTRSLASIYRQGITDIIKRINNNEKASITGTLSHYDGGVHRA